MRFVYANHVQALCCLVACCLCLKNTRHLQLVGFTTLRLHLSHNSEHSDSDCQVEIKGVFLGLVLSLGVHLTCQPGDELIGRILLTILLSFAT